MNTKRKKRELVDRKNPITFAFWNMVNHISIATRFRDFQIIGAQNLPKSGPFLLVANHSSRWDGLIAYKTIGRPANFMVSPNELVGLQGAVLTSMGSFPADPRADLITHALNCFQKGEGIVVFPEGNTFYDGITHPFKTGAAKIAVAAAQNGINLPIIPASINYADDGQVAQIALAEPIFIQEYLEVASQEKNVLRILSDRLHREVCFLRVGLGNIGDRLALFTSKFMSGWTQIAALSKAEIVIAEGDCSESNVFGPNRQLRITVPLPEPQKKVS